MAKLLSISMLRSFPPLRLFVVLEMGANGHFPPREGNIRKKAVVPFRQYRAFLRKVSFL